MTDERERSPKASSGTRRLSDRQQPREAEIALDFPLRTGLWRLHKALLRSDAFPFAYLVFESVNGEATHVRLDLQKRATIDPLPREVALEPEDLRRLARQISDAAKRQS